MSTNELSQAAALMRQRAEAVCAGADEPDMWFGAEEIVTELMWGDQPQHGDVQADAQHIASWHPAVALAVAAWLEEAAESWRLGTDYSDEALAVAHAYLGSES